MIVEWLTLRFFGVLGWLVDLIPDVDAPAIDIPGPVVVGYTWLNDMIPVDVFLQGAVLYFGTMGVLFGIKVVLTIYRLIPFKAT